MGSVQRRPRFNEDEGDAYLYIALRNPQAADSFLNRLQKLYENLAEYPELGVGRLKSRPDARIFPYGDYVILYLVLDDESGIALVRLYGPREDWEASIAADASGG